MEPRSPIRRIGQRTRRRFSHLRTDLALLVSRLDRSLARRIHRSRPSVGTLAVALGLTLAVLGAASASSDTGGAAGPDPAGQPAGSSPPAECSDGIDNDGDGLVDQA